MERKWQTAAGLLLVPLLLTACGHGHSASPKVGASVSAVAVSPQVRADEAKALSKLEKCTAVQGVTYQVDAAAMPHPTVTNLHASLLVLHHFSVKVRTAIGCAASPSTRSAVKACVKHLALPVSKAGISDYVTGIADCMVGAPQ